MPNVDERVVQMTFDNRQFESGVSQSLKTLDDLKKALNFDEVEGSLKNIENAFNNLDLSGLADSVDFIASRFEPLGKIADVALSRIADKALDAGKKIADAFFGFSDMSAGQGKYETQTKAVQTITNATGKSVAEVETVLEKLQKYTDETSYDFAEMVNSIGKFTSVGVELERAERAMEGIASEAAKSGAGKAEANRAMYNFAQALSAGAVKLQDWKSIENANMATKEFKETIIQTAIELGVLQDRGDGIGSIVTTNEEKLKKAEQQLAKAQTATKDRSAKIAAAQEKVAAATKETTVNYKNFNETLSDGWFTSDVLIATLEKYADTTTEFGLAAYHAAQEALTWTDAIDAVHDAVSSGWMQSFKYIFGDLDEARQMWTNVANALVEYTDIFTSWRNSVLKSWHEMGGYNDMIEAASNLWQTFMNIVKGVGEALTNVFPILKADNMTQALVDGTKKLKDWSGGLLEMFGIYQEVEEEEKETAEKAGEIADKTNEITKNTAEASQEMTGLGEATKKAAANLGAIETGLKRGMRGENVKKLQKELIKYGFRLDRFGADGIFGPETQAALKALQREIGVAETGIMDEATKAALKTDEALRKLQEHAKKGISIGARGEDIKKLQKNLNKYLGESDQLIVDGIFGPKTEAAIKKLQKELGIAQTGVFDQTTRNAIKTKKILLMNVKELSKELKEGMTGADVKKLQQELIKGGYLDKGMADGIYGPKTKEAIKKLQKALGIKQTGEWDKATQIALHNSQQLTRAADTTAKANKKISQTSKQAAADNKKAAEEAANGTQKTTIAMKKLQAITRGFAAGIKIITKFAGSIVQIAKNIAGMFTPIVKDVRDFVYFISGMIENLSKQLDEDNAYKKFVDNVTSAFDPLRTFLNGIHTVFHDFLKGYELFLKGIDSKTPSKYNTFTNFLTYIKENYPVLNGIINVLKGAGKVIGTVINFISGILSSFFNTLSSEEFQNAKNSVFSWISDKISKIGEAITKFREDHPELTIENFLNKIKEIGGWVGGKFGEGIDTIKNKFAEFKAVIDRFAQDHPELSISNIFEKIKDTFKGIGDMFSKFFFGGEQSEGGSFYDTLKERFKAFEPVLDWMDGIKDRIVKLWQSIFGGGEEIKTDSGVAETVKAEVSVFDGLRGKMSGIQSIVDWFVNLKDKLINAWNDLTNVGKTGGPDLVKEGGFTTVFDRLGEFSKEMAKVDLGKVISTALKTMAVYSLLNISNGIKNFGKGVGNFGKGLEKMVESLTKPFSKIADKVAQNFDFKGLSKAISERIKYGAQEKEAMSTKIMKLAGSILMVVAAIAIITKVLNDNDKDTVDKALTIVGGIIVALGLIAILMTVFSKKKEGKESDGSVTGILALCAGIYVIMLAIGKAVKIISETTSDTLEKALWIVGGALVILGVISVLISAFSKGETSGVKGILSLCAGVYVLVLALEKTIKVIQDVDEGTLKTALWIVGGATALLGIFAVLISATSKGKTSGVKGLLSMCAGVYVLVLALEKTVQLVTNTKNKEDLWSAVGIVGGMIVLLGTIAVLVAALSKQPKVKVSIFKSLVGAVAVLVGLMAVVVGMIAQYNAGVVWQAFAMIAILVGGLGAIAVLMGKKETDKWTNLSSAAVFLSMAFMIEKIVSTIGDVLYKIKDVNPEVLKWFFIGIDGAIAILALLVNAFTKIPLGSILSADVGLLAFIGVLAAGMEMIGSVAADLVEKFSYVIQTLGYCLESFANSTSNLNFEQMKKIAKFVKEILPAIINGIVELPTGEALNKARGIQRIGINLKNFGDFISSITKNTLESADYSVKLMKKTKAIIDKLNEITFPSLGKEGAMEMFGASLVIYGQEIKHTDTSSASSVTQMIKESLEAVKLVKDATWLDGVTNQITTLGAAIKQYYKSFEDVKTDENGNAIEPKNLNIEGMAGYIRRLAGSFQDDETIQQISSFAEGGNNDMYQVGYGITALGTALETYADSIGKLSDKETEIGLANGIIDKVQEINKSYDKDAIETFYNDFSGEFFNGTTLVAGNIVVLGEALGSYANNISIIEPSKVHAANLVLDKIKEIKQYLSEKDEEKPKNIVEKLVEALVMPNDFKVNEFAEDIQIIGEALEVYGGNISKLSIFQIWKANAILDSIANLNNSMPLKPGWFLQMMYDIETLQSFATGLKAIGEGLSTYWGEIKDLTFDDSKQESANKILDGIADIAVKLSRGGNWISQARSAVPSVKGLTDGLSQVATDLVTFGSTVKSLDTSKTTEAVALLSGLVDAVSKVSWDDLMHGTGLFGANKVSKFAELGSSINAFLTNLTGSLDTELKNSDGESRTKIESAGQTIIDALSSGVTNAKIDDLNTAIFSAIDTSTFYASLSMVPVMNTLGTDILSWIETGLKDESATTKITGSIESLIGKIKTVFTNNWNAFKGIGMFINLGLATGMKENQSIVTQAAEDVALAAYLAAKKKLGIASPSTEYAWLGEMSDEGYAKGMLDNASVVNDAAEEVQKQAAQTLNEAQNSNGKKSFWEEFTDGAKDALTTIGTGVSNAANAAGSAIKTGAESLANLFAGSFLEKTDESLADPKLVSGPLGEIIAGNLEASEEAKAKMSEFGTTLVSSIIPGMASASAEELPKAVANAIENGTPSDTSGMEALGESMVSSAISGMENEKSVATISQAYGVLLGQFQGVLSSKSDEYEGIGQSIDSGIATGMHSNQSLLNQVAEEVAWSAYLAAKKKLGIASPSTEFMWLGEMSDKGYAKGLTDNAGLITNAASGVQAEVTDAIENAQSNNESKGFWSEFLDGAKYAVSSVGTGISNAVQSTGQAIGTFVDNAGKFVSNGFEVIKGTVGATAEAIKGGEFFKTLFGDREAIKTAAMRYFGVAESAMKTAADDAAKAGVNSSNGALDAGKKMLLKVAAGLSDQETRNKAVSDMNSALEFISNAAQSAKNKELFSSVGKYMDSGIAQGLETNQSFVTTMAEKVAWTAYLAAKKKLGIASPSTEFMWIGEMMDAGLTKGLETYGKTVSNAAGDVADNAVNTAAQGILALNDVLGFDGDYQPVIRPVLDLSNIQANAASINDLLTPRSITPVRSAALASNIAATQRSRQAAEVQSNGDGTYKVFGQALQKFDEKMQDVSEAIKNMKIYMDGNTLVGYVSPRVNRTLGHQATLAGRMN